MAPGIDPRCRRRPYTTTGAASAEEAGPHPSGGHSMEQFPIFLTTSGGSILIVGSGVNAARKARLLSKTSARLDVIATAQPLHPELQTLADAGTVTVHRRPFTEKDVDGRLLVIAAAEADDAPAHAHRSRRQGIAGARECGGPAGPLHVFHASHRRPRPAGGRHWVRWSCARSGTRHPRED